MLPALLRKRGGVPFRTLEWAAKGTGEPATAAVEEGGDAIVHRWVNRGERAGEDADIGPRTKGVASTSVHPVAPSRSLWHLGSDPHPEADLSQHPPFDRRSVTRPAAGTTTGWEQALDARLVGRDWRPRALLVPILAWFAWSHTVDPDFRGIYAGINLAIHEAGHLFLSWFGSSLVMVAGGTLFEVGIPALIAVYFWRHGDVAGTLVGVFWVGTALLSVAPYMADARAQALPLVSVGPGPVDHDWYRLLEATGLLRHDRALARMTRFFGLVVVWGAVVGLIAALSRMRRLNDETATDREDRPPFGPA